MGMRALHFICTHSSKKIWTPSLPLTKFSHRKIQIHRCCTINEMITFACRGQKSQQQTILCEAITIIGWSLQSKTTHKKTHRGQIRLVQQHRQQPWREEEEKNVSDRMMLIVHIFTHNKKCLYAPISLALDGRRKNCLYDCENRFFVRFTAWIKVETF